MKKLEKGDIVQITNENHSWFPCLVIVDEPKSWGLQGYVLIPKSNDGSERPSSAYIRLKTNSIEMVGTAVITTTQDVYQNIDSELVQQTSEGFI